LPTVAAAAFSTGAESALWASSKTEVRNINIAMNGGVAMQYEKRALQG
jgi:hypothetical protein